ncbi:MAG: radical SAM family heme chaperone HemW [Elusimicrobia bacterium]|nr:radical SAM family heme chaperone HemW [Elusimicrobiota bacterium]
MRGLYLHIPFCSVKCYYCDFVAFSGQGKSSVRYLQALQTEMRPYRGFRIDTLYMGGGTPTELSAEELDFLLTSLGNHFGSLRDLKESTVEANPESLTSDKMKILRAHGMSRISLGLQTTQDSLLKSLGRQHTSADFVRVFGELRKIGFKNLNVDLMFGVPEQSIQDFQDSLNQVCVLEPEHVSLYGLHVEEKTVFNKRGFQVDEDLSRQMYEVAIQMLGRVGYRHYEVSNFAKPGYESVHNQIYWRNEEYLGFGCGATSYLNGVRRTNTDRFQNYLKALEEGSTPVAEEEKLEGLEKTGETILLGLRMLEGLHLAEKMKSDFKEQWQDLQSQDLVVFEGSQVKLSSQGIFVANRVFQEFVPPFP